MNNDRINAQYKLAKNSSLDLYGTRRICEDGTWRMQFSGQANHSFENKVFIYQTIQSKKAKKCVFKKLVQAGISGFIYGFYVYDGKNSAELGDGKLVIYRNVHKLLQSCVMIFLATKIIKCSLTGWQRWISYITLDWKDYMLLVQFNWLFARFSSWYRQRLHEKWQRH